MHPPKSKKIKMSKCEYLAKVLDAFKAQNPFSNSVTLNNRTSLPLFDEVITVDLSTNKMTQVKQEADIQVKIEEASPSPIPTVQPVSSIPTIESAC
jgi:hypothetical protein